MSEDAGGGRRPVSEGARLLRQRAEMGAGELFLDGMTRERALELAKAARAARSEAARASAGAEATSRPSGARRPRDAARSGPARSTEDSCPPPSVPLRLPDSHEELRAVASACARCRLAESRTHVVFSDGPPDARLIVVGEAPGANEDRTGLPFVGAAGKFLDLLLATVGLSREESVYICNVLKCRPPGNRNPLPDEISTCSPFLEKQIEVVRPEALLAVGSFSAQLLTGREKATLGKLRGEVHAYRGVPLVVTYHPAALLRNPKWTRAFWDDLQLLRAVMDGH